MDRYIARLNIHGTNTRDRTMARFKNSLTKDIITNPSYKNVKINDVDTNLIINSGTQPYYKEFQSLPNQDINIGDYVEWANSHWLVYTCDSDDELYKDGKLYQCNYLLKWQNESGEIIERWAYIASASKYNDGTSDGKVINLGTDQLSVAVPIDEQSIKLKKSTGKKFFIDNNTVDPTVYELTGTGNVPDTYNGHGVTSWIVKEIQYSPTETELEHGICNYFEPTKKDDESNVLSLKISYSGSNTIMIRSNPKTFKASLIDKDGNDRSATIIWEVSNIDGIIVTEKDGCISISCNDENLDGETITITATDEYTGFSDSVTAYISAF